MKSARPSMSKPTSVPMSVPIRRDMRFDHSGTDLKNWHSQGPLVSNYMNALSIFFPEGERFFIHSLRQYRDQITDPELKKAVTGFIGQEAMHGREHEEYNELLASQGLPADVLGKRVDFIISQLKKLPKPLQLSITIALEHFTAIYGDHLLRHPELIEGSDPTMAAMWNWHALEETEHKAVAFDVYRSVMGKTLQAYALRTGTLAVVTALFLSLIMAFHVRMVAADKQAKKGIRQWAGFAWFMLGPKGGIRKIGLPWLDYFKPGFHPWDHDNRHFLPQIEELEARYAVLPIAQAA